MRGGSPGRRRSTTITSIPRQARSRASVRPTGPAPTMSTSVSSARFTLTSIPDQRSRRRLSATPRSLETAAALSLRRDLRLANHAAVFLVLPANERAKIRAANLDGIESQGGKLHPHSGDLHRRSKSVDETGDCFPRGLRGRKQPEPAFHLVVAVTGLRDRRHIRKRVDPRPRGDREGTQPA